MSSGDACTVQLKGCSNERTVSHKAECFCICSCFCSPLSGPLCDCREACTLVAARSGWKTGGRVKFQHTTSHQQHKYNIKNSQITQTGTGELHNDSTERLTSNSSQKPCLTLSVASASLLSSRTRLSISAALIRVVFRGCGGEKESAQKLQPENAAFADSNK